MADVGAQAIAAQTIAAQASAAQASAVPQLGFRISRFGVSRGFPAITGANAQTANGHYPDSLRRDQHWLRQ